MERTKLLASYHTAADRVSRFSFTNFNRGITRVLVGSLLLGSIVLSLPGAQAGDPVTVGVTVTGADGQPVQGAEVSITEVGVTPSPNVLPESNSGTTGRNGSASFSQSANRGNGKGGPLPAGVYRVEVKHGGKSVETYVHVPAGQTGTTKIDLSKARPAETPSNNAFGASGRAHRAAHDGNRGAYDTAVGDLDRGIGAMEDGASAFEDAIDDFRREHGIPPTVDTNEEIDQLIKDLESARKRAGPFAKSGGEAELAELRWLLQELRILRGFLDGLKELRKKLPPFPNQRSAEREGDSQGSIDGLPWLDDDNGTRHVGLDRASERVASNVTANQGQRMPRVNNISVHTYHFEHHF